VALFIFVPPSWAASGISFYPTKIDNQFPQSLTFDTTIYSTSSTITSAWFVYTIQTELSDPIESRVPLTLDPAQRVKVSMSFEMEGRGIIVGVPILFHWEAQDENGLRRRTEDTLIRYEDNRFEWQVLEEDSISVWWHDRPQEFGEQIFEVAATAVADQSELFQTALQAPIRLMIYNDMEEFEVLNPDGVEGIWGRAYPEFGITAQVVPMNAYLWIWMHEVIPHEISHLYLTQVTWNNLEEYPPSWLDEGIAQFNELNEHKYEIDLVQEAADKGELIPLTDLTDCVCLYDGSRLDLAYAESYSAVQYLIETSNPESLADIFSIFRSGRTTDDAFETVLGYDMGEFQRRWLAWLGTSMTFPPTQTPLAQLQSESYSQATREATKSSSFHKPTPTTSSTVTPTPALSRTTLPSTVPLPCIAFALPSGLVLVLTGFCFIVWRKYCQDYES
jgi:hypothetical protein